MFITRHIYATSLLQILVCWTQTSTVLGQAGKPVLNMNVHRHQCECRSKSHLPAIMAFSTWQCSDSSDPLSKCSKVETSVGELRRNIYDGLYFSSVTLNHNTYTTGYGVCEATSIEGTSFIYAPLMISKFEDKLTILRLPLGTNKTNISVGDRVVILCASKETNNIVFIHNGIHIFVNITEVFYLNERVYLKQLTLDNITENDQGTVECQANDGSGTGSLRRSLTLAFSKASKPIKKSKQLGRGSSYKMECKAEGNPKPTIEWFKDEEPLHLTNSSVIQFLDGGTVLSFTNVTENDSGSYKCRVTTSAGYDDKIWFLDVRAYRVRNVWIYSGSAVLTLLVVICVILYALYYKKRKEISTLKKIGLSLPQPGDNNTLNPQICVNDQTDALFYDKKYDFAKERLTLGKRLGSGNFGVVMKATARLIMPPEEETTVAVKMVKTCGNIEETRSLVSELKIMIHIGKHLNVVNLLGAVVENVTKNSIMVIVEYCPYGNVADYLKRHQHDGIHQVNSSTENNAAIHSTNPVRFSPNIRQSYASIQMPEDGNKDLQDPGTLTVTDLVCWASQVACGMNYLVSKNVLHGDLAARNILLCDGNVVKICDFGLAQSMREDQKCKKQDDQMLPVKWLALECLQSNKFGTSSDVWAYGVMLWEFFSLAQEPYKEFKRLDDLVSKLRDGYRLECPAYANREIYELMMSCWENNPDLRPTFKELNDRFDSMLSPELQDHYMKMNQPYMDMNGKKTNYLEMDGSNCDKADNSNAEVSSAGQFSTALNRFYMNYFPFRKSELSPTMKRNLNSYFQPQKVSNK